MIDESKTWTISDIQKLVDNKEKESTFLEYKACNALQKNEESKFELSRDISAFANAGGGIIIYGVIEKNHLPKKIDKGYDPKKINREWLESVINSRIHRKIEGLTINQIEMGKEYDNRVLYCVTIPQSNRAPHQAGDKIFYTRKNFMRLPMEEYEIRDVFNREKAPNIILELFFKREDSKVENFPLDLNSPETVHELELNGILKNEGGGEINNALITLIFDSRLKPDEVNKAYSYDSNYKNLIIKPFKIIINEEELNVMITNINWGIRAKMPLFKSVEYKLLRSNIKIHFKSSWLMETISPFILWEIRAPGMEPNKGHFSLKLDDSKIFLDFEEPTKYLIEILDDKSLDFLKTPDLSYDPELIE